MTSIREDAETLCTFMATANAAPPRIEEVDPTEDRAVYLLKMEEGLRLREIKLQHERADLLSQKEGAEKTLREQQKIHENAVASYNIVFADQQAALAAKVDALRQQEEKHDESLKFYNVLHSTQQERLMQEADDLRTRQAQIKSDADDMRTRQAQIKSDANALKKREDLINERENELSKALADAQVQFDELNTREVSLCERELEVASPTVKREGAPSPSLCYAIDKRANLNRRTASPPDPLNGKSLVNLVKEWRESLPSLARETINDKARVYAIEQACAFFDRSMRAGSAATAQLSLFMLKYDKDGEYFVDLTAKLIDIREALPLAASLPAGHEYKLVLGGDEHAENMKALIKAFRSIGHLYPKEDDVFWKYKLAAGASILVYEKSQVVGATHFQFLKLRGGDICAYIDLVAAKSKTVAAGENEEKPSMFMLSCVTGLLESLTRRGVCLLRPSIHRRSKCAIFCAQVAPRTFSRRASDTSTRTRQAQCSCRRFTVAMPSRAKSSGRSSSL